MRQAGEHVAVVGPGIVAVTLARGQQAEMSASRYHGDAAAGRIRDIRVPLFRRCMECADTSEAGSLIVFRRLTPLPARPTVPGRRGCPATAAGSPGVGRVQAQVALGVLAQQVERPPAGQRRSCRPPGPASPPSSFPPRFSCRLSTADQRLQSWPLSLPSRRRQRGR